jgi:hypothetical protein
MIVGDGASFVLGKGSLTQFTEVAVLAVAAAKLYSAIVT